MTCCPHWGRRHHWGLVWKSWNGGVYRCACGAVSKRSERHTISAKEGEA